MLKLVTQFDNPEMRPSVATPTCGPCCCCCCCCVVTTITSGVITSRNIAHAISANQNKIIHEKIALRLRILGATSFLYSLIGGVVLAFAFENLIIGTIVLLLIYSSFMAVIVKRTGLEVGTAITTIIITTVVAFCEAWVWLWFILG